MKNKNLLTLLLILMPNLAFGAARQFPNPYTGETLAKFLDDGDGLPMGEDGLATRPKEQKRTKRAETTDSAAASGEASSSLDLFATAAPVKPSSESSVFASNEELLEWIYYGQATATTKESDKRKGKEAKVIEDIKTVTAVLLANALWEKIGKPPLINGKELNTVKGSLLAGRVKRIDALTIDQKRNLLEFLCATDDSSIVPTILSAHAIIEKALAGEEAPLNLMSEKDIDLRAKYLTAAAEDSEPATKTDSTATPPRKIKAKSGATPSKKRGLHSIVSPAAAGTPRLARNSIVKAVIGGEVSAITVGDEYVELESTLPEDEWEKFATWAYGSTEASKSRVALIQSIAIEKRVASKIAPITQHDPEIATGEASLNRAHLILMPEIFEAIRYGKCFARNSGSRDGVKIEISCVVSVERSIKGSTATVHHTEADAPERPIIISPKGSPTTAQELELIFGNDNNEKTNCSPCILYHALQQTEGNAARDKLVLGTVTEEDGEWVFDTEKNRLVFVFSDYGIAKFRQILAINAGTQKATDALKTFMKRSSPGATPSPTKKATQPRKTNAFVFPPAPEIEYGKEAVVDDSKYAAASKPAAKDGDSD